jgi:hypothetical protein
MTTTNGMAKATHLKNQKRINNYFSPMNPRRRISRSCSNGKIYFQKLRRRIEKDYTWNGSAWTQTNEVHFIYDGNLVIQERDTNNAVQVTYTRGNDLSCIERKNFADGTIDCRCPVFKGNQN